ncbi:MAG: 3-deoxy-7-phosphoheptulonate synthase [Planctomycetota bacterium]|nr:3-deoxy-7-phosphoheptulonate synthase [Planctomycetota bacterium]
MIIVMRRNSTVEQVRHAEDGVRELGLEPRTIYGVERTVIAVVGDERIIAKETLEVIPGVEKVMTVLAPYKLACREMKPDGSEIPIGRKGDVVFGGRKVHVVAGPCSVESRSQLMETAEAVRAAGASALRAGAFKPRTNPYSFQGLAQEGLELLAEAREKTGLPIVTEVLTPEDVPLVARYADVLQIGTRNMQNYMLLKAVGALNRPVLLKRGMSARIEELLLAAEYILIEGNRNVLLCERGIRTFEDHVRNTLPLASVPALKERSHLPVLVDPSHGTGVRSLVPAMSRAAVAAGCDGLLLEVHPDPERAVTDGQQTLDLREFEKLMVEIKAVAAAIGREG